MEIVTIKVAGEPIGTGHYGDEYDPENKNIIHLNIKHADYDISEIRLNEVGLYVQLRKQ